MFQVRTDLAIENRELYQEENEREVPGVKVEQEDEKNYIVTRVKVLDETGAKIMGKPIGSYITIEIPQLKSADEELRDKASKILAKEIKVLAKNDKRTKTLIVGLGNWNVTPDALGPKVIENVIVTRQYFLAYQKEDDDSVSNVSAISPGVMGLTGIETGEIIKGIVEKTSPDIVIAIDALASRNMNRVSTTIQISDTGINPGSGVGNKRIALNEEYLGVPVISIGIPTVVDAATMVNDTMDLIIDSLQKEAKVGTEFYSMLNEVSKEEKHALIKEVLEPFMPNVVVTPKEIDELIDNLSEVIGTGLNRCFHHSINV
ncbi:MAG TPA: GPR endopeptidase [Tissierellales bacterium]|nr:GPR endopeptidase [Tissierellales bacterium]